MSEDLATLAPFHSLYGLLIRLTLNEISNEAIEVDIPEPTISVGENKELDELLLHQIQSIYEANGSLREVLENHSEINEQVLESFSKAKEVEHDQPPKKVTRHRFQRDVVVQLNEWLFANQEHPFPSHKEKEELSRKTGLSMAQVNQWFTNARRRTLKKH
mmetsp:Transcript_11151/g.19011  ORF Transcript_11151/g.19011 Transcript_11151/m.19011 type:complete len:160 (+) Transcript_11151:111-590(+)